MKINTRSIVFSLVVVSVIVSFEAALAGDGGNSADLLTNASRSVSRVEKGSGLAWQETLTFEKPGQHDVAFRAVFHVKNPKLFASLTLKKPLHIKEATLNGKTIPVPLEGMRYNAIPGIPTSLLKKGSNTLQAVWPENIKGQGNGTAGKLNSADIDIHLSGLTPSALAFQTGPVLGYAGKDFFTVTCRVNIPAEVVLEVNKRKYVSKSAL